MLVFVKAVYCHLCSSPFISLFLLYQWTGQCSTQCDSQFTINCETIPLLLTYKYPGRYVNEFLDLIIMVAGRVEARRKAVTFFYNECDPHLVCLLANLVKKLFTCLVQWYCMPLRHGVAFRQCLLWISYS